jgi:bifunctional non-homologous end joining protein LigD
LGDHSAVPRSLDRYRDKRKAEATPEPAGDAASVASDGRGRGALSAPRVFVVQQHLARRLHWDLRLEWNGVLLSWAVPHGPSYDTRQKALAVETEDHPLEYADFEGVIPQGNYGAGAMIVWDRGRLVVKEDFDEGLAKGKLLFELQGYKLHGLWTLVRIKKDPKNWLLIKERDAWAVPQGQEAEPLDPRSVFSGLTAEELRDGWSRAPEIRAELERLGAPRQVVDGAKVKPMLAEARRKPFSKAGWIFELKIDGYRALAEKVADADAAERTTPGPRHATSKPVHAGRARLWYRSGIDAARIFPEIARAVASLPYDGLVLDGEVASLDEAGRPVFQLLQKRGQLHRATDIAIAAVASPTVYFAFDLLAFEDFDLRGLPLVERKRVLQMALPTAGPLRFVDHVEERGEDLFREVRRIGIEGVVGKKADSTYRGGRFEDWQKTRADHEEDFAIVGFTAPKGSRAGFGAIHLAALSGGKWVYVGRAGSGFTDKQLTKLYDELAPGRLAAPPCEGALPAGKDDVWVPPQRVATVRYVEGTEAGQLRQPVFVRFRTDKAPEECVLSSALAASLPGWSDAALEPAPPKAKEERPAARRRPTFSNLDKIFWPAQAWTKGDLIEYYRGIAPWLLPYLADRPVVLTRFPDGIEGKSFFQKNAPHGTPEWLETVPIVDDDGRETDYFVVRDVEALTYLANLAAIPLHVWASRVTSLARPDWTILDLDPKGASFQDVVAIAQALRRLFDELEVEGFVKTSGASGMHVLLPLGGAYSFDVAKNLALLIANVIAHEHPEIATVERVIEKRGGRVYVDALQNGAGKLLVSVYSARPVPAASVSMPLRWDEVDERLDPKAFHLKNAVARLESLAEDPFRGVLGEGIDVAVVIERLAERLER